jgi:hypothetical protein
MEETIKILMRRIEELERKVTYLTTLEDGTADVTPESIGALPIDGGGTVTGFIDVTGSFGLLYPLDLNQRWSISTVGPETGSNSGSNFTITRYADNGSLLDFPLDIRRDTGYIRVYNRIYAQGLRASPGSPETSELYVDASGFVKRG